MCFFNFLLLGLREVFLYLPLRMGVLNQVVLIGQKVSGSKLGTPVRTATESEAVMSHHLDCPIARQDVRLDITDLYVFRGEMGTVFIINVCHSIAGNIPVPGYHPEGMYEFKIDLDGDAVENLTYRVTFDERDAAEKNLFAGCTVYSIVLEVPDDELLVEARSDRRIGVWALSTLATDAGGWRSINRVGLPMIHPLFTQYNMELGNHLNAGCPAEDFATHGETVINAIAGAVAANGTAEDPRGYAEKVAHRFCPNVLPYTIGTPAVFGFAEWNGRSLTDNAPNVMFSIAANTPVRLGIGKESVTSKPSKAFPYVPAAPNAHGN